MTKERYNQLMDDKEPNLTEEERDLGWHYCLEFDFLLVGPGMQMEISCCDCLPKDHVLYINKK